MDYEGLLVDLKQMMLRASQSYLRDLTSRARLYLEMVGEIEDFIDELQLRRRVTGDY